MKCVLVAEVPESLNLEDTDENGDYSVGNDVVQTLADIGAKWPSSPAISSQPVGDRKIIYIVVYIVSTNPILALETVIEFYGLDWQLLAGQTFDNQPVEVVEGEDPVPAIATKLMEPDEARLFDFIPDSFTLDENGDPTGPALPKHINQISAYSGQSIWQSI